MPYQTWITLLEYRPWQEAGRRVDSHGSCSCPFALLEHTHSRVADKTGCIDLGCIEGL